MKNIDKKILEKNELIIKTADDKLAQDIKCIKIDQSAGISDFFIVMTGRNKNHTQAIADAIEEALAKAGSPALKVEGFREGSWILLDCSETIVHIFTSSTREFYNLEALWTDKVEV